MGAGFFGSMVAASRNLISAVFKSPRSRSCLPWSSTSSKRLSGSGVAGCCRAGVGFCGTSGAGASAIVVRVCGGSAKSCFSKSGVLGGGVVGRAIAAGAFAKLAIASAGLVANAHAITLS